MLRRLVRNFSIQAIFGSPNAPETAEYATGDGTEGVRNLGCGGLKVRNAAANNTNWKFQSLEEDREPQVVGHVRLGDSGEVNNASHPKE